MVDLVRHDGDMGMDAAVLPGLLGRVGPSVATQLKRQLAADLLVLRQDLGAALAATPDLGALGRHAHVLAALAGTAGATGVTTRARLLLRAAHRGDTATALRLANPLLDDLDALVAFVAACPLPDDPPH